jgi:hypothetical protein
MDKKKICEEIPETSIGISVIQKEFSELSDLFQDICIPYLLLVEDKMEKLIEVEQVEMKDKYEQFKLKTNLLAKIILSLMSKSDFILVEKDTKFINHIDVDLYEAIRIFEDIDADNQLQSGIVRNAQAAYLMLARLLNTMMKMYNDSYQNNQFPLLHNIPDPQFYEIIDIKKIFSYFKFP